MNLGYLGHFKQSFLPLYPNKFISFSVTRSASNQSQESILSSARRLAAFQRHQKQPSEACWQNHSTWLYLWFIQEPGASHVDGRVPVEPMAGEFSDQYHRMKLQVYLFAIVECCKKLNSIKHHCECKLEACNRTFVLLLFHSNLCEPVNQLVMYTCIFLIELTSEKSNILIPHWSNVFKQLSALSCWEMLNCCTVCRQEAWADTRCACAFSHISTQE